MSDIDTTMVDSEDEKQTFQVQRSQRWVNFTVAVEGTDEVEAIELAETLNLKDWTATAGDDPTEVAPNKLYQLRFWDAPEEIQLTVRKYNPPMKPTKIGSVVSAGENTFPVMPLISVATYLPSGPENVSAKKPGPPKKKPLPGGTR